MNYSFWMLFLSHKIWFLFVLWQVKIGFSRSIVPRYPAIRLGDLAWTLLPGHYNLFCISCFTKKIFPLLLGLLTTLKLLVPFGERSVLRLDRELFTSKTYFRHLLCQERESGVSSHLLNIKTYWSFKYSLMQKMQSPFISIPNCTVLYQINIFDTLLPRHREILKEIAN